jgi:alkylation response protein AidB-like acyl-CoA dehydrogenase
MDLEPTDDQAALVAELRRLLSARVPTPAAADPEVWDELAAMGVLTLPVPEDRGGVGLGWAEAALAFQELGRSGVAGPFVATAAAHAAGVAEGVTGLVPDGPGGVLVEHLDRLDTLLAVGSDGAGVRRLPLDRVRHAARPVARPLDPLTPVHLVDALPDGEPGELVGDGVVAGRLVRHAALLAAAVQVGLGWAAVDMATAYAEQRQQFGRAIGSFQAVKHLLAEAAVGLEVARAAVDAAAVTLDEALLHADIERAVASARVVASDAARAATRACVQVHGGMGYTWDLPAHLLLKRVLVLDQIPTSAEGAVDQLVAALG